MMHEELNTSNAAINSLCESFSTYNSASTLYYDALYEFQTNTDTLAHNFAQCLTLTPAKSTYLNPNKDICADRFIPIRNLNPDRYSIGSLGEDIQVSMTRSEKELNDLKYQILLKESFSNPSSSFSHFKGINDFKESSSFSPPPKLLQFQSSSKKDSSFQITKIEHPFSFGNDYQVTSTTKTRGIIPDKPYKVLDIPLLQDDFYQNPIEWSKSNYLAIALKSSIYLWSGFDGTVKKFCTISDQPETTYYNSVSWSPNGEILAVGTSRGDLELWDLNKLTLISSSFEPHSGRIGCLAWSSSHILATGSKDSRIFVRDLRIRNRSTIVQKLKGHKQEVCSLKWSPNTYQIASGGSDNKLLVWNMKKGKPEIRFNEHKAAIKALDWSPNQTGVLISGGGNNDRTIKTWNTLLSKNISSIDTGSQVCNLAFSSDGKEVVSSHGLPNNEINIWKFPDFAQLKTLKGHKNRVLYLAISPDKEKIVTGAGTLDASLRFWKIFEPKEPEINTSTSLSPMAFR